MSPQHEQTEHQCFAAAWREGKVEDTPQNASDAIEALALREAMQPTAAVGQP